jgi:hypothetical protein
MIGALDPEALRVLTHVNGRPQHDEVREHRSAGP